MKKNQHPRGLDQWPQHVWPPFTQILSASPPQRVIGAKEALLLRENAPPLIDANSSWWVTLHGHANEYIAEAISQQATQNFPLRNLSMRKLQILLMP